MQRHFIYTVGIQLQIGRHRGDPIVHLSCNLYTSQRFSLWIVGKHIINLIGFACWHRIRHSRYPKLNIYKLRQILRSRHHQFQLISGQSTLHICKVASNGINVLTLRNKILRVNLIIAFTKR